MEQRIDLYMSAYVARHWRVKSISLDRLDEEYLITIHDHHNNSFRQKVIDEQLTW